MKKKKLKNLDLGRNVISNLSKVNGGNEFQAITELTHPCSFPCTNDTIFHTCNVSCGFTNSVCNSYLNCDTTTSISC